MPCSIQFEINIVVFINHCNKPSIHILIIINQLFEMVKKQKQDVYLFIHILGLFTLYHI